MKNPQELPNFFDRVLAYIEIHHWTKEPNEHSALDLGRAMARVSSEFTQTQMVEAYRIINYNIVYMFPGRSCKKCGPFNDHPETLWDDVVDLLEICSMEWDNATNSSTNS